MDQIPKKNIEIKKEKVTDLAKKIGNAKTVVFADFRGLTASQITDLRQNIKDVGGELIVAKNTLIKRALQTTDYRLPTTAVDSRQSTVDLLSGPTAILFSYEDETAPIKETAKMANIIGIPKFKFGYFDKSFLDTEGVATLAKIPGREILHGQVVRALSSPIYGLVFALQANIRNLISVLDQKTKQVNS